MPVYDKIQVEANGKKLTLEVGGYIDRLDMMIDPNTHEEAIRVVDYKRAKRHRAMLQMCNRCLREKTSEHYMPTIIFKQCSTRSLFDITSSIIHGNFL